MKRTWLVHLREKQKFTQAGLANQLQLEGYEISPGAISHWENGRYDLPMDDDRFRNLLAGIFKITPAELLAAAGYETQAKHSEAAERAAALMDQIPEDKRDLALGILEKFLETN